MEFNSPLDVANRVCQLLGAMRITSFTENSKAAAEIAFAYDKLRRAELERNSWVFSIVNTWLYPVNATTMRMVPAIWSDTAYYPPGSLVKYTNSYGDTKVWVSLRGGNLGQEPDTASSYWRPYFGPLLINQFIPQTAGITPINYNVGDVVYMPMGTGVNQVFMSLENGNQEVPNVPDAWAAYVSPYLNSYVNPTQLSASGEIVGQYNTGDTVQGSDGWFYMSLIDLNQNNNPIDSPFPYNSLTTYASGAQVAGKDGYLYQSLVSSNIGNEPTTDSGAHWENMQTLVPWCPTFTGGLGSNAWLQLNVTLTAPNILYPIGAGPVEQAFTNNIFPLPANFLRRAAPNPKAGAQSWLGGPIGNVLDDYVIQGGYLTSHSPYPINLRCCVDDTDVMKWPAMFAEGLAARIGYETCEMITQSTDKQRNCSSNYALNMREARAINAIISGPTMPPVDDFIVCRL